MIVIDASSLAKYVLREENWKEVRNYLLDSCSLSLALAEVSNAIWKHSLYGRISREQASKMFKALEKLKDVVFEPFQKYLENAVDIAMENYITVYDALYIAQAMDGEILTSDDRQKSDAKNLGIDVLFID